MSTEEPCIYGSCQHLQTRLWLTQPQSTPVTIVNMRDMNAGEYLSKVPRSQLLQIANGNMLWRAANQRVLRHWLDHYVKHPGHRSVYLSQQRTSVRSDVRGRKTTIVVLLQGEHLTCVAHACYSFNNHNRVIDNDFNRINWFSNSTDQFQDTLDRSTAPPLASSPRCVVVSQVLLSALSRLRSLERTQVVDSWPLLWWWGPILFQSNPGGLESPGRTGSIFGVICGTIFWVAVWLLVWNGWILKESDICPGILSILP